ncbi:EamA family transporter RarD [Bacillus lacus]|uniref:EamA family transporter RarD n=1 Tax=Metabacillus lacus TaxID=1983721 RepID=A0A7X2J0A3_9BACI|nr:EamA family transporter RarD [Metabacillus lacus]MRX72914.1 EamA family transporter RarD [Metabacillus lacus]
MENNPSAYKSGIVFTALSYLLWGILPVYWKLVETVPADEILAHRILWSFIFMLILITFTRQWTPFISILYQMKKRPLLIVSLCVSSLLISTNWFVYIWAVNNAHMVDASLGYYINPLVSVLLGMIFLKEKLNLWQQSSFLLAGAGVLITTIHYGIFPWVAVILALSFGLYGLTKKVTKLNSTIGLTFETMAVLPAAIIYLAFAGGASSFADWDSMTMLLLVGAGVVTAVPLLLFASGAQRIPLFMVGILQYIAPTITLFLGVIIYGEPFSAVELVTFILIWSALLLFTFSQSRVLKALELKVTKKKTASM